MRPVGCPQRTGHGPELSDVKSRAGKRVVTLPAPLVVALRAHRTAQLEERLAAGSLWWTEPAAPKGKSWDLVFRQPDGKPVGHKRDYADWKVLLLKVPARVVMDILGHSSYQLTMNTHSHVAPELNNEAARLMAGALWWDEKLAAIWLPIWLPTGAARPAVLGSLSANAQVRGCLRGWSGAGSNRRPHALQRCQLASGDPSRTGSPRSAADATRSIGCQVMPLEPRIAVTRPSVTTYSNGSPWEP